MALKGFEVTVEGTSPLLCSNVASSDPLGEGSKQKAFFHSKRKKNDEDHRALRTLDWIFSGYWGSQGEISVDETENTVDFEGFSNPTLPGANFQRCLRNAATKWKLGKDVLRSVVVSNDPEIEYDGPKNAIEMFNSRTPKFQLAAFTSRGVWVNRLMFPLWKATYRLTVDDEILSVSQLKQIITMAGKAEGLGTWRPRHGRFTAGELVEVGFDA
jgi:hypothetical protein